MEIKNHTSYNQSFKAKLGWRAVYELKNTPEKLNKITRELKDMGEPTTVVDIMSADTKKGKLYSLRLFNEIFKEEYNISLLKDKNNKDVVSSSAKEFLPYIENLTKSTIEQKEHSIFNKIGNEHSNSLPMIKYLKQLISQARENGKYLSKDIEQTYFKKFV